MEKLEEIADWMQWNCFTQTKNTKYKDEEKKKTKTEYWRLEAAKKCIFSLQLC